VSVLTGRATSHKATLSTTKSYSSQMHPTFEPKVFTELRNAQSIVLAYDGLNPLPPTYCYLKPHYLDKDRTYFEQLAKNMNIPTVGTAEAAWSRIIPFLRPIEPLIRDPEIFRHHDQRRARCIL